MTESRPSASDLLSGVIAYLEQELLPPLDGRHRFHVRVAANALNIVKRELELGPALDAAERERLIALLHLEASDDALNRELVRRIRDGMIPDDDALMDHLLRSVRDALAINNPKWVEK